MNNKSLLDHIHELVAEEKQLRGHGGLDSDGRARLESIERELDQLWDLLRQRRAREEYGENPDEVKERSENDVESYLQ